MKELTSICAVSWNNKLDLSRFLYSVFENSGSSDTYELVIVDNGSNVDTVEYLKAVSFNRSNMKVIYNKQNEGIGKAMNLAMREAQGDWIARCDTDIIVPNYWLNDMKREYLNASTHFRLQVGAVGTAVTGGTQIIDQTGDRIKICARTDFMTSCCILIPRRAIETVRERYEMDKNRVINEVRLKLTQPERYPGYHRHLNSVREYVENDAGYWDRGFMHGADDFDYSLSLRWSGMDLIVAKAVPIVHYRASEDSNKTDQAIRHKYTSEGFQYYRTKWEILFNYYGDPKTGWADVWHCLPMNIKWLQTWQSYQNQR